MQRALTRQDCSAIAIDAGWLALAVVLAHGAWLFGDVYSPHNDYLLHYLWADQFAEALSQGIWRPAWVPDSRGGLGDPVFVYYMPLFYYLVALAERLTGDIWVAIKLVCAVAACLTGAVVTGFARARGLGAGWARGLGVLAIMLPVLVVVRGTINAYPWFVAHLFLALAMIALLRYLERPDARRLAALALAVAVLCVCHTLTAGSFLLTTAIALLADWALVDRSRAGFGRGLGVAAAFLLGLALAAPAALPSIATLDLITPGAWNHKDPLLITWFNTFAFPVFTTLQRIPFSVLMPWGSFVLLVAFLGTASRAGSLQPAMRAMIGIAVVSAVLCTELSYPLWEGFTPIQTFQRPFRFLSPMTFAILIGAVPLLRKHLASPSGVGRLAPIKAGLVALLALAPLPVIHIDALRDQRLDPERAALITPASTGRFFGVPEHLPANAGPGWQTYLDAGGFAAECGVRRAACKGGMVDAHLFEWWIETRRPIRLTMPLMGYPGWQLSVGGTGIGTPFEPGSGLIEVDLPAGKHLVSARWEPLPEQRLGDRIGLVALIVWIGLSFWARLRQRVSIGAVPSGL